MVLASSKSLADYLHCKKCEATPKKNRNSAGVRHFPELALVSSSPEMPLDTHHFHRGPALSCWHPLLLGPCLATEKGKAATAGDGEDHTTNQSFDLGCWDGEWWGGMRRAGSGWEVLKNRVREKVPWDLYFWCHCSWEGMLGLVDLRVQVCKWAWRNCEWH